MCRYMYNYEYYVVFVFFPASNLLLIVLAQTAGDLSGPYAGFLKGGLLIHNYGHGIKCGGKATAQYGHTTTV